MPRPIPERPALEGLESQWSAIWESEGTHRFDRAAALAAGSDAVYAIDTPPPTASGSLHIGHVFSYTHMDLAARFQRMRGKHLFYPMGWDDNGLPTERRVQNYYGVRCDPTLPYVEGYVPPTEGVDNASANSANQVPISRRNFIELCDRLTIEDEQQFEDLWRALRDAPRRSRSCATSPVARRTRPGHRRSGMSPSARRSRRPSSKTKSSRVRCTALCSTVQMARPSRSTRRVQSSSAPTWRWWRTQTTLATAT